LSAVAHGARSIAGLASSQDLLAGQIARAMELLSEVDARVLDLAGLSAPPRIEPRQLRYFAAEEDLFDSSGPPDSPSRDQGRQRVVVIRKPRSDAVEIPLAGEIPEQVA
jgi:hypothetical protein